MAVPKLSVEMELKLKKFQDDITKAGGIATKEGKAMSVALSRDLKAMLKASEAAGDSLKKTGKATAETGIAANKALKALGPLGGVLARLSPEAGAAASSIAAMTGGMEGMLAAGAPVAAMVVAVSAVVALGAIEFAKYREEQAQLAAIVEDHRIAEEARKPVLEDTRSKLIDLKVATGQLTEEEGELERASLKAALSIHEVMAASLKQLVALQKQKESWTTLAADAIQPFVRYMGFFSDAFDAATTTTDELDPRISALTTEIGKSTAAVAANLRATKELITAGHDRKDAIKGETQATKDREEADKAAASALEKLSAIEESALDKGAVAAGDAYTKIDVAREASARAALDALDAGLAAEAVTRERQVELFAKYADAIDAIDGQASEERRARAEEDASDAKKRAEDAAKDAADAAKEMQALDLDRADQAATLGASVADLQRQLLDNYVAAHADANGKLSDGERAAARKMFESQKGVAIASVGAQTAVAIMQGAASGPWPYNLLPIGIAAATGATQLMAVSAAQPSFHTGRADVRPDEINARLQSREAVSSRQGADLLGRDNIAKANSGRDPFGNARNRRPAPVQYRHREYNRFIRDNLLAGGPLSEAIGSGTKVGHRSAR